MSKITQAFIKLGEILADPEFYSIDKNGIMDLEKVIRDAESINPWFTTTNSQFALKAISGMLKKNKLEKWLQTYSVKINNDAVKTVAVIMAGNIPLVGFHDFLCVLISGNKFLGKLSSDDTKLLPALAKLLVSYEPDLSDKIEFKDEKLSEFDAVIATGSTNSARYFEYYFGKYPNIIRKNRNGVAVINGNESTRDLEDLGKDIFMFFGLGCRSIAKLFVPAGYKFDNLLDVLSSYKEIIHHHKYKNNYDYYRSIYLINKTKQFDNWI